MLLSNIITLSSFPNEKIGVFLDNTIVPEVSSRFGLRFRTTRYDGNSTSSGSNNILNWNNPTCVQSGLVPELSSTPSLSSYFDPTHTKIFTQPTNFISIPADFPVFFDTTNIPANDMLMNFRGGLSAITIFPTRIYPLITKIDNNNISISGAILPLTALNTNITSVQYYPTVDLTLLQNLENTGQNMSYFSSYYSAHKRNVLWKKVTTNPLYNTIFNNDRIPSITPYDKFIIPQSFTVTFPISSATLGATFNYTMSYASTTGGLHFLSALPIESWFSSSLSAYVNPVNPIATQAFLTNNLDNTFGLTVNLDPVYQVPKNSNITMSYDTSGTYISSTITHTHPSINTYNLSAQNPIYFYTHQFSSPSLTDAITVFYTPSALITQPSISSVSLSTIMVDNFSQTTFPILVDSSKMVLKFVDSQNDQTLSAIDPVTHNAYITNTWFPASANVSFINNGVANYHSITFQLSSYNNSVYNYGPNTFILNLDKINFALSLTNVTDVSATVVGNLFPTYDLNQKVQWTVYPPDNIILTNPSTNANVPLGASVNAGALSVNISNLGVDKTTITLYSQEFGIYASTQWFPTSAIYSNVQFVLSGNAINDYYPNNTTPFSALMVRNHLLYPIPENAFISWSETLHDSRGHMEFITYDGNTITPDTIQTSLRNFTNIDLSVAADRVTENPQNVTFDINSKIASPYFDLSQDQIISIRQYPSNANIFLSLTGSNGQIINTSTTHNSFFTAGMSVTGMALTGAFSELPASNIVWHLPPNNTVYGISAIFNLTDSFCIGVTGLSAKPLYGGFGYYDFIDDFCIYYYPPISLDYISFPQYNFFPYTQLSTTNNTYLSSVGMTGLSSCYTQSFIISTFGGFEEYHYQIGDITQISTSNITTIEVSPDDVVSSGMIYISAFNGAFPKENPLTIYNTAQSDNSNIFRQPLIFNPFPTIVGTISSDNDYFNLQDNVTVYFDLNLNLHPSNVDIKAGTITYVLSSNRHGVKYWNVLPDGSTDIISGNTHTYPYHFSLEPTNFFSIAENTSELFNFFISGSVVTGIPQLPENECGLVQEFTSNILSLSAYDGYPSLQIYTTHNLNPSNTTIYFQNETSDKYITSFQYFVFNDGNNNVQTVSSYTDVLTGFYTTDGVYSPSMSGIYSDGTEITNIWENFIIIEDEFMQFDDSINRHFPAPLTLPTTKGINPNEWQFENTFNKGLLNLHTNISYLSSMTTTYDINIPKFYIGWAGEQKGQLYWRYDTNIPNIPTYSNQITQLKSFHITDDRIYLINGNKLEIRINDFSLSLLYSSNMISEGETFQTPSDIVYNSTLNKILVLDSYQKFVYAFDVTDDIPTLTHYWGGVGSIESRTKLNNPTDLYIDSDNNIFVVDSDSSVVKIYNKFLNWLNNITCSAWGVYNKPLSISNDGEFYYVLSDNGIIYTFDLTYKYVTEFKASIGNKICAQDGILYITSSYSILAYTRTGIFLNNMILPSTIPNIRKMMFLDKETFILTDTALIKLIDYTNTQSVKSDYYSLSSWTWDSILIKHNEPVTTFVINDAFKKIHDNIYLLGQDIAYKFVINLDEYDGFLSHSISAINTNQIILSSSSYQPLGINELASYDTINRMFDHVYYDLECLRQMLDVEYTRAKGDNICWSWKSQTIDKPRNIINFNKPFSWFELRKDTSDESIYLSGGLVTWQNMKTCCGETNTMHIKWIWNDLTCCSDLAVQWYLMTPNREYMTTWAQLEDNCEKIPKVFFDDCVEVC